MLINSNSNNFLLFSISDPLFCMITFYLLFHSRGDLIFYQKSLLNYYITLYSFFKYYVSLKNNSTFLWFCWTGFSQTHNKDCILLCPKNPSCNPLHGLHYCMPTLLILVSKLVYTWQLVEQIVSYHNSSLFYPSYYFIYFPCEL